MTGQHPITPPPEMVEQWSDELAMRSDHVVLACAAQWGADQELEACCGWFQEFYKTECWVKHDLKQLRASRRPQPPSVRKQAYDALDTYIYGEPDPKDKERTYNTIRKALEQLNDE